MIRSYTPGFGGAAGKFMESLSAVSVQSLVYFRGRKHEEEVVTSSRGRRDAKRINERGRGRDRSR